MTLFKVELAVLQQKKSLKCFKPVTACLVAWLKKVVKMLWCRMIRCIFGERKLLYYVYLLMIIIMGRFKICIMHLDMKSKSDNCEYRCLSFEKKDHDLPC